MEKNPDPEEYVFSKRTNPYKPLSRSQAYRIIKEDASHTTSEEAISCHSLRKTFGYYAWQEGVQPALLMNVFNTLLSTSLNGISELNRMKKILFI